MGPSRALLLLLACALCVCCVRPRVESPNVVRLRLGPYNDTEVTLCGSAHALGSSVDLARRVVREERPDVVFLELCDERAAVLAPPQPIDEELSKATLLGALRLRRRRDDLQGMPLLQFMATYYQARVAAKMGVQIGAEFRGAFEEACAQKAVVVLFDRRFSVTGQRLRDSLTRWERWRLFVDVCCSLLRLPSEAELEAMLREGNAIDELLHKLGKRYPTVKTILVDERDQHMLYKLREFSTGCKRVVAIVGAAHLPGIQRRWRRDVSRAEVISLSRSSVHRAKTLPMCYVLNAS